MSRLVCAINGVPELGEITVLAEAPNANLGVCRLAQNNMVECRITDAGPDEGRAERYEDAINDNLGSFINNLFVVEFNGVNPCNDPLGVDAIPFCTDTQEGSPQIRLQEGILLNRDAIAEGLERHIEDICTEFAPVSQNSAEETDAAVVGIIFGGFFGFCCLLAIFRISSDAMFSRSSNAVGNNAPSGTFML